MITWTAEELKDFERTTDMLSSSNQLLRIEARQSGIKRLKAAYGEDKCNAMHTFLVERDAKPAPKKKARKPKSAPEVATGLPAAEMATLAQGFKPAL